MIEENIGNITKSNSNFAPAFVDHYFLPDINFNGHHLINNIYISKNVIYIYIYIYIYFLHTESIEFKKFAHRLCIQ